MLTVKSDNDIQVKLGDQLETLLTNMLPYKYLIGMVTSDRLTCISRLVWGEWHCEIRAS